MIAGTERKPGLTAFASQVKTLGSHTDLLRDLWLEHLQIEALSPV
ncbi:MAG: hypothetical protein Q8N47_11570 [Bryobacterales bacterium]|nr:hypothetical protein [Bryobacterales bacterium]